MELSVLGSDISFLVDDEVSLVVGTILAGAGLGEGSQREPHLVVQGQLLVFVKPVAIFDVLVEVPGCSRTTSLESKVLWEANH